MSYARRDQSRAEQLATCLKREGWAVWWDISLGAGEDFAEVIERQINSAPVVVVLWSATSVTSGYVRDEANVGRQRGTLVPVAIDTTEPPLGFRYLHTHSLVGWDGGQEAGSFLRLARVIGDKVSPRQRRSGARDTQTARTSPGRTSPARTRDERTRAG